MSDLRTRACANTRCQRRVFDARIIKNVGAPVDVVLDAEPVSWADGARFKIMPTGQPVITVMKLTATQIHKAFGNVLLFVEHRERCEAEARRTKAKTKDHA